MVGVSAVTTNGCLYKMVKHDGDWRRLGMSGHENAFSLDDKSCTVKLLVAMVALVFSRKGSRPARCCR